MARRKLRTPQQPPLIQALLGLFEFSASLKLAVILILSLAGALAYATFVESAYGTPAVHFGVYGTGWFMLLCALLAVNIFSAAAIRYPWKKHQTGFVITHIGLLTLLLGCLITRLHKIDSQMPIFEGEANHIAFKDQSHFELTIYREPGKETDGKPPQAEVIEIPFVGGPFNWQDYSSVLLSSPTGDLQGNWFARDVLKPLRAGFRWTTGMAFRLASRNHAGDVLYDRDGIKLEVLDYFSDSRYFEHAPYVKLQIGGDDLKMPGTQGKGVSSWKPVELAADPSLQESYHGPQGSIPHRQTVGGGEIVFWTTSTAAETDSFLNSAPQGAIGPKGQVVLNVQGKKFPLDVAECLDKGRFPLTETGLDAEVERLGYIEQYDLNVVTVNIYQGDQPAHKMALVAESPELNQQDPKHGVFGTLWFDRHADSSAERMQGKARSRIDIVQGPGSAAEPSERSLYYRVWRAPRVTSAGELKTDGTPVDTFKMPIGQLSMKVEEFVSSAQPGPKTVPEVFDRNRATLDKRHAALVRLTVDDKPHEFWLAGIFPDSTIKNFTALPRGFWDEQTSRTADQLGDEFPGRHVSEAAETGNAKISHDELIQLWQWPERQVVDIPAPSVGIPLASGPRPASIGRRAVVITMAPDVVDIGFDVKLDRFQQKLDPGTSEPSHFSSWVDFVDTKKDKTLQKEVWITMNAPVDFSDPNSGHAYRLFQESFNGPFEPGNSEYERHVLRVGGPPPERLYRSTLTVNYDPGRSIAFLGCGLVIVGIFTMFFMRAYFFKPQARAPAQAAKLFQAEAVPEPVAEATV